MNSLNAGIVDALAEIEVVYLQLQTHGVLMVIFRIAAQIARSLVIAANEKEIVDAEEIEVEKSIFGLLLRKPTADDMGNSGDAVFVLERTGDCDGAGALEHAYSFQHAVGHRFIDIFAVMGGDVDEFGIIIT